MHQQCPHLDGWHDSHDAFVCARGRHDDSGIRSTSAGIPRLWEAAAIVVELYEQYLAAEAARSGEESSERVVSRRGERLGKEECKTNTDKRNYEFRESRRKPNAPVKGIITLEKITERQTLQ